MRNSFSFISFLAVLFGMTAMASAQTGCEFRISGEWQATAPGETNPYLYRFTPDGKVAVFDLQDKHEHKALALAAFNLENPEDQKNPKTLEFRPVAGSGRFPWGTGKFEVVRLDEERFTLVGSGMRQAEWARKDPYGYFLVLAAHRGTPPHQGGPAFGMLIKTGGRETEVESFGLYYHNGERVLGAVPEDLYRTLMKEPVSEQDAVLRVQVTAEEFARSLTVIRSWQKRAGEGALLFPADSYLNIVMPLKEMAESLNQCHEAIKLHKLTWLNDDPVGAKTPEWALAFEYVRKLRQLNDLLHIPDGKFQQSFGSRLQKSQ